MNTDDTTNQDAAILTFSSDNSQLNLQGDWTVQGITSLAESSKVKSLPKLTQLTINGECVARLDSAGALLLQQIVAELQDRSVATKLTGFKEEQRVLLGLVEKQFKHVREIPVKPEKTIVYQLGEKVVLTAKQSLVFLSFWGEICVLLWRIIRKPRHIYWRSLLAVIETCGYNGLPIIGLLCFLVGVTLAYQMGLQLRDFGAGVFIVDLIGISILREFGPLITAIILAGRTASAFTAQLGTMKINEEIDALQTMGVSPMELLVLPKIVGMILVVPLLSVWADFFGVLGGMMMAKGMFGIPYSGFLERFNEVILLKTFLTGLVKTPVFAMIITTIGCYQGFRVSLGADSVGRQTTRSVVQSIFFIIVADAAFSVYFSWIGV